MYNMAVRIVKVGRGGRRGLMRKPRGKKRPTLQQLVAKVVKGQAETKYVSNAYQNNLAPLTANWFAPTNLTAIGSYYPQYQQ